MIKKILFIVTLLLGTASYVQANDCVDNKSVESELAATIRTGRWITRTHIEPLENGAYSINTVMAAMLKVSPETVNYIYSAAYLENNATDPILTQVVYSSQLYTTTYHRQLISYNAKTKVAIWNDRCLDKTVIKK